MISVEIYEEDLLDALMDRVRYWTDDLDTVELYKQMYDNYVYDGCFDGAHININEIVDNDYVNYCDVVQKGDQYYEEVLKAYNAIGNCGDCSCDNCGYSFIEAVIEKDEEDGGNVFLCRW